MWKIQLESDPLFEMGALSVSEQVIALFAPNENRDAIIGHIVARHLTGDWGEEIGSDLSRMNDVAVREGKMIMSVYTISGQKVVITTDGQRSATMVYLAQELLDLNQDV